MSISVAGLAVGPGVGVRAAVAGRGVAAVAVAAKKTCTGSSQIFQIFERKVCCPYYL